jgi:hypothetical protein
MLGIGDRQIASRVSSTKAYCLARSLPHIAFAISYFIF